MVSGKKKISLSIWGLNPHTTRGNLQQWRTNRLTDHEFLHALTLFKAPKFDKLVIFQSFSQLQILVSRCSDVSRSSDDDDNDDNDDYDGDDDDNDDYDDDVPSVFQHSITKEFVK